MKKKYLIFMFMLCCFLFGCNYASNNTTAPTPALTVDQINCQHTFVAEVIQSPTCVQEGMSVSTCSKCGKEEHFSIPMVEHTWMDATCSAPATCSVCIQTKGTSLGCSFGEDKLCVRCQSLEDYSAKDSIIYVEEGKNLQILQITDLHLTEDTTALYANDRMLLTFNHIRRLVGLTNPDVIVVTGNIFYYSTAKADQFRAFMDEFQTPWTFVFGSYDATTMDQKREIAMILTQSKYCIFQNQYENEDTIRMGDHIIQIREKGSDKLIHALYLFDSGMHTMQSGLSLPDGSYGYESVWNDQLDRYKQTFSYLNAEYQAQQNNTSALLPHTIFQHLAVEEYAAADDYTKTIYGSRLEANTSGKINTGEFALIKETGAKAIFVGHDHQNCYAIVYQGIQLGCGGQTGYSNYYPGNEKGKNGVLISIGPDGGVSSAKIDAQYLELNTSFPINDNLPEGNGQPCKVIVLMGQSNASGTSRTDYLQMKISPALYAQYAYGFDNVLINYSIDNQRNTSLGAFTKVNLECGCREGFFGPEVGMAEVLSTYFKDEKIIILKYSLSGSSLNDNWLFNGQRGDLYNACIQYLTTYLDYLQDKNYDVSVDAICWMQGGSDCFSAEKASQYQNNLRSFVSYLRQDLKAYQNTNGIYFIDAGIADSPFATPEYVNVNTAKEAFSKESALNVYFSTIDHGLTTMTEPYDNPDTAHYDALSEIKLGHLFAEEIIKIYQ